jgi:hypothetical protein
VNAKISQDSLQKETYNLIYGEIMSLYDTQAAEAKGDPHKFVQPFTDAVQRMVLEAEETVRRRDEGTFGMDAPAGKTRQTVEDWAEKGAQGARDVLDLVKDSVTTLTGQATGGAASVSGSSARPAEASPTQSDAPPAQGAPAGPASSSASPPRPAKASTESTPAPGSPPVSGPSTGSGGHADSKPDSEAVRLVEEFFDRNPALRASLSTATTQYRNGLLPEDLYREQVRSAFRQVFAPGKNPSGEQLQQADVKAEEFMTVVGKARQTRADKRQQSMSTGGSSPARSADGRAGMGARVGGAGMGTASPSSSESAGRAAQEVAPDKASRAAGQAPVAGSSAGSSSGAGQASGPSERPRESQPSAPPRDTAPGSTADRAVDGRRAAPDRAEPRASSADRSPRVEPGRADAGAASAGTPPAPSAPRDPFAGIQRPPDGAFKSRTGESDFGFLAYVETLEELRRTGKLTEQQFKDEIYRVDPTVGGRTVKINGRMYDFRNYPQPSA